jgi:dUTP pyrophosphatase
MEENQFVFCCADCGKSYKTIQALTAHRRVHKPVQDDPQYDQTPVLHHQQYDAEAPALPEGSYGAGPYSAGVFNGNATGTAPMMPNGTVTTGIAGYDGFGVPFESVNAEDFSRPVVKVKRLPHGQNQPELQRATSGSAAVDLYAAIEKPMPLGSHENAMIPTGLCFEIPEGYVGKVVSRSGLAAKQRITVLNSPGIIDSDYRGEVVTNLYNHGKTIHWITPGERVAQMLFEKVEDVALQYVDELSDTDRGDGGFGSTGR